jgi:LacI family transcriptional regulator
MPEKAVITIQDIALKANVSISTVSRVLNGTAPVAESTREKVLKIIDELGYIPNPFARGLAGGQSRTIGVLTQLLGSPFFDVILRGILKGIDGSGFYPLFADGGWNIEKEKVALEMFLQQQVNGMILISGHYPEELLMDIAGKVPLIIIGRDIELLSDQCIPFDDFDSAKRATQYLINSGHRRIALITGLQNHNDAIMRRNGYYAALEENGIELIPDLIVEGDYTEPSGVMAVEMLMSRKNLFSAIFATNDQMAYGARLALHRHGLRVPEDISVVGFDDQAPTAYMIPPLTTIQRQPLDIGEAAGQGLLQLMQGKPIALPNFKSKLIIRESVIRRL